MTSAQTILVGPDENSGWRRARMSARNWNGCAATSVDLRYQKSGCPYTPLAFIDTSPP